MEHRDIDTNGTRLHVVQAGPANGPVVVLLHGFPELWRGWRHQIEHLAAAGFRVWAPDQRGYNLSDKPRGVGAYGIDTLAADVVGLLDAARVEKVGLVGHDWGGVVAWRIAARHPSRVSRMVVINAPHGGVMQRRLRHDRRQLRRSWYFFFFQLPWLPEWVARRRNWKLLVQMLSRSSRPGTFSDTDLDDYREAWSQPHAYTSMVNWYRAALRVRPARLATWRITVPTLLIWGAKDAFLKRELAEESISLCDDGRLVYIDEATHWVQHEEAARVNHLLVEHLSG